MHKLFCSIVLSLFCSVITSSHVKADEKIDLFGVSTAAYQIEGAWNEDGKGISIWDHFTHARNSENGDVACDEYHKVDETIQLLKNLGVNAYRFSISWTRIQPNGTGEANPLGIAYYRYLINELKKAGIAPMVTIYHWDLPQKLEEDGGWTNRDTALKYVDYAKILFLEFGEDVSYWITHNEPRVVSTRGYGTADMAPGLNDPSLIPIVDHHLLLSHGLAVQAYREMGLKGKIGISLNLKPIYCFDDGDALLAETYDIQKNKAYLDPILKGEYPDNRALSFVKENDMSIISEPLDFLGVNYYSRLVVSKEDFKPTAVNSLGWETFPKGIYDLLIGLKNDYPKLPPIIITENGFADELSANNSEMIQDNDRINYITSHINAVKQAKADGVPVMGYMVWSLLDNLEWSFGYKPRFGLIHVDYSTLKRTPKASYYEYQKVIRLNRSLKD